MFFEKKFYCLECKLNKTKDSMAFTYEEFGFCSECSKEIKTTKDMTFDGKEDIEMVICPFLYEGPIERAIKTFKFQGQKLYGKFLANLFVDFIKNLHYLDEFDLIIPVPLHKKRLNERGFNQADILSKEIGEGLGIQVSYNSLMRLRDTKHQSSLNGIDRVENVKDAFWANEEIVKDKNIIIVDDIYTMGETTKYCATALKEAGANRIIVAAICRTVSNEKVTIY